MTSKKIYSGLAIALAWPQSYCRQAGAWYDPLMRLLGFNKGYYYQAGHAALVLVDKQTGQCLYFDFGRYHAPMGFARARSGQTDPELKMTSVARFTDSNHRILNLRQILDELQRNESCHGAGPLHAAVTQIDYFSGLAKALEMQQASPMAYGPFVTKGSNCSRFVHSVILAGNPPLANRLRLRFLLPVTPSPMSNVKALEQYMVRNKPMNVPVPKPVALNKESVKCFPPPPAPPAGVSGPLFWLTGLGAGSWFRILPHHNKLVVSRYSPQGILEGEGIFEGRSNDVLPDDFSEMTLTYPSDCSRITLLVNGARLVFEKTDHEAVFCPQPKQGLLQQVQALQG